MTVKTIFSNVEKKTKKSLIWTSLLNEFFVSFFAFMPFILRKDLLATTFQISLYTALKPAVAVLSFYWGSRALLSKVTLRSNLVVAGILARIPFLFFPFFGSVWYMIFASTTYMLFSRAAIPAWMEILKLNLNEGERNKLFSLASILAYSEGVLIIIFLGTSLNAYPSAWKYFFVISTILGLFSVYIQLKTPIDMRNIVVQSKKREGFLKPWKDGFTLMKKRKDFAVFQIGSIFCGFSLMLLKPAETLFYADSLKLTLTEVAIGRYIFMSLGFVVFSFLWTLAMKKRSINYLLGYVSLGFGLFPFFLMLSVFFKFWFYVAFLTYGITQSGSHLLWHLSGPSFAKDEDSSQYSAINVLMVGMRGLIAPLVGGLLCDLFGSIAVFAISITICFFGSFWIWQKSYALKKELT